MQRSIHQNACLTEHGCISTRLDNGTDEALPATMEVDPVRVTDAAVTPHVRACNTKLEKLVSKLAGVSKTYEAKSKHIRERGENYPNKITRYDTHKNNVFKICPYK